VVRESYHGLVLDPDEDLVPGATMLLATPPLKQAEDAPKGPGAYVLLIELAEPLEVALPSKPKTTLETGRYLYCGSAKGPGGIRARLTRHMRVGKLIRWHMDRLTEAGTVGRLARPKAARICAPLSAT
jgi:hypothetical protein